MGPVPRKDLWCVDGYVNTLVRTANSIYLGGQFRKIGPYTGSGVCIDESTGAVDTAFPKVTGGDVLATAADGAGGRSQLVSECR